MFLGILVLITALSISAVAIYYSVAGLVAIFAAAAVPIMIMGGVLEIGKLVTAVWLHRYWHEATWWLKSYLTVAVLVLMFITSMGIFGFLSRAHIEQTANAREGIAQIERITTQIAQQNDVISRAQREITNVQQSTATQSDAVQRQIDIEQERIDTAYNRIQPAIDEQLAIIRNADDRIAERVSTFEEQLQQLNQRLADLDAALNANDVRRAQGIVGARQDGALGPNTSAAIQNFRDTEELRRSDLIERIDEIRSAPDPVVQAARDEISRLRNLAEQQIQDSNVLINRLRSQLGTDNTDEINQQIENQQNLIAEANSTIDTLTEQKYSLEIEYRKLEAEVGPVKYLAEFIYGEAANQDLLEEAVRWVIIIIIFVFDPLAVLLLIASQQTFEMRRANLRKEGLINEQNFGRFDDEQSNWHSSLGEDTNETNGKQNSTSDVHTETEGLPQPIGTTDDGGDITIDLAEQQRRIEDLENKEQDEVYKSQKQEWKAAHPDQTVKFWKDQYIKGKVDILPWENVLTKDE